MCSSDLDVITADPIHPWNQGSGYLFTAEYYAIAKQRLDTGGVMCQWLPLYGLSVENFKSIVATFSDAFPYSMLWQNVTDAVLIGSDSPIRIDLANLTRRLKEPSVAAQLEPIGLADPYSLLAEVALQQTSIREYARGAIINTDDNLRVEFSSPFDIGTPAMLRNIAELNRYRGRVEERLDFLVLSDAEREAVARSRRAKFETLNVALSRTPPQEKVRSLRRILREHPDYRRARRLLAKLRAQRGVDEMHRSGPEQALGFLEEAVMLDPWSADAHRKLGAAFLLSGHFDEAIQSLERSMELRPGRWKTHSLLARAQLGAGRADEAKASLRTAAEINPHNPGLAAWLARLQSGGTRRSAGG